MQKQAAHKPELLAPAGRTESFFSSLTAGADAVYLGLKQFNARLRAENFTLQDLSRLIPFAHDRGKKVYVTLNTVVKQRELPAAAEILHGLQKLKPDGVIVADYGLIALAGLRFPGLPLHASTQAGIHNSAGAAAMARLGIKRVILARELSLEELSLIRRRVTVELEVFVHGALCYSLSGDCLASSWIGGRSGNRGLCTQVCRRVLRHENAVAPFFSMLDLESLDAIPELVSMKIDAFKIEGRMKGSAYLSTVVSVYRRAIDHPDLIPSLKKEISGDLGRGKTRLFMGMPGEKMIQDPKAASAAGLFLGNVFAVRENGLSFRTEIALSPGDSLRVQPAAHEEGKRYKIAACSVMGEEVAVTFHTPVVSRPGDRIFLVERKAPSPGPPAGLPPPRPPGSFPFPQAAEVVKKFSAPRGGNIGPALTIKTDSPELFTAALRTEADLIVFSPEKRNLEKFSVLFQSQSTQVKKKIGVSLPSFIGEKDLTTWETALKGLTALGVKRIFSGIPGLPALSPELVVTAEEPLKTFNIPGRVLLAARGFKDFCVSPEDDFPNIRAGRAFPGIVTLFARVPLFVSRVPFSLPEDALLQDRDRREFVTARRGELYYLLGTEPLCLFHQREKLAAAGIKSFLLDFSFLGKEKELFAEVLAAYREKKRILPSTLFNFKRELV